MRGRICGTGASVPERVIDNNALAEMVDTSDVWIRERTGVHKRHIIGKETTVSMAVDAGRKALENGNVSPEDIELLIVSTFTSEVLLPCTACEVQRELGAVNAICFDLNAACTGFLFACQTAQSYIASGMCGAALVIGSESLSNTVNWQDRGTCILFGDGAGAAVLCAEEGAMYTAAAHSDGSKGSALTLMSRHRADWNKDGEYPDTYIQMDGRRVFEFAVKQVPKVISEVLEKNNLRSEEIDYFILHQANRRIVEAVAKRLKTGMEKFPVNLQEYGNTSSASIPILLDEMNRSGKLVRGDKLVIAGFGAGLSWGAMLLEW